MTGMVLPTTGALAGTAKPFTQHHETSNAISKALRATIM
jgi:hypothetical protein